MKIYFDKNHYFFAAENFSPIFAFPFDKESVSTGQKGRN